MPNNPTQFLHHQTRNKKFQEGVYPLLFGSTTNFFFIAVAHNLACWVFTYEHSCNHMRVVCCGCMLRVACCVLRLRVACCVLRLRVACCVLCVILCLRYVFVAGIAKICEL
jgi:hypothetical protein